MRDKEKQRHYAYEALQILMLLALLTFITRIWPILLLVILGIFIAVIRLLFLSSKLLWGMPPHTPYLWKRTEVAIMVGVLIGLVRF